MCSTVAWAVPLVDSAYQALGGLVGGRDVLELVLRLGVRLEEGSI